MMISLADAPITVLITTASSTDKARWYVLAGLAQ
jgi:hypothetical protein